jgi:hypothetical protein
MKLKPGLHLFMVANDKGGASKSTACAEARVACSLENLPSRLITFDGSNRTLNDIFRGEGVHLVAKPNGDVLLETLGAHIDQARLAGEIIIADMPPGITDADNSLMRAFAQSQIFEEFDSIGLIVPVFPHHDHIKGALDALSAFNDVPIKYDRGMIRAWRPEPTSPNWDSFVSWETLAKAFPVWECPSFMESLSAMMQHRKPFGDYPALDMIPNKFAEMGSTLSACERGQLRAAVNYLEAARKAIRTHLLEPIMEKAIKPSKAATA